MADMRSRSHGLNHCTGLPCKTRALRRQQHRGNLGTCSIKTGMGYGLESKIEGL